MRCTESSLGRGLGRLVGCQLSLGLGSRSGEGRGRVSGQGSTSGRRWGVRLGSCIMGEVARQGVVKGWALGCGG